jgi:hypothetical protein
MKQRAKSILLFLLRVSIMGACGLVSVFLLMSGYESVYNRSLPFVHTLDPVPIQGLISAYDLRNINTKDESMYGNFGHLLTLKLPKTSLRLDIAPAVWDGSSWLARANALHLLIPEKPRNGNLGVGLMYCRSSFRTIYSGNMPKENDNILIDTDHDWRYVYRVTSAMTIPDSQSYIPADSGTNAKLVIGCNDAAMHTNFIIEASLLSVQGVEK